HAEHRLRRTALSFADLCGRRRRRPGQGGVVQAVGLRFCHRPAGEGEAVSDTSSAPVRIVVMEGDGIGPEITAATLEVLGAAARAFALDLSFAPVAVGFTALRAHG